MSSNEHIVALVERLCTLGQPTVCYCLIQKAKSNTIIFQSRILLGIQGNLFRVCRSHINGSDYLRQPLLSNNETPCFCQEV